MDRDAPSPQAFRIPSGDESLELALDHERKHVFLPQCDRAENDRRNRDNRAHQQRPHKWPTLEEERGNALECFDHQLGYIGEVSLHPIPSLRAAVSSATSSGIGGRLASSIDWRQTLAKASFEVLLRILISLILPLRSTMKCALNVPMLILSDCLASEAYQRDPIESVTIF